MRQSAFVFFATKISARTARSPRFATHLYVPDCPAPITATTTLHGSLFRHLAMYAGSLCEIVMSSTPEKAPSAE